MAGGWPPGDDEMIEKYNGQWNDKTVLIVDREG